MMRTSKQLEELKSRVTAKEITPFIGSGVSANLGLPAWAGLVSEMSKAIDYDGDLFLEAGEFPSLAEFYEIEMGERTSLAAWMKTNWDGASLTTAGSAIHSHLTGLGFQKFYTTNYDHLIERAFSDRGLDCHSVVDARDFWKLKTGAPVVIKFHGDLDMPDSMVLTETDYHRRMSLDNELDLMLRVDAISGGLLFLGYSLSDRNLRYILHKQRIVNFGLGTSAAQTRSYLFTHRRSLVETKLLARWNVEVILSEELEPKLALENFLGFLAG